MIQQLIYERFEVFYNVFYLAQLLKHLGFSYQKAAFVSDHLNEEKRHAWCTTTWPQICHTRRKRNKPCCSLVMRPGSPRGGRSRTRGRAAATNPLVKTSGKRKG